MPGLSVDFGLFIAYLIPGFILVVGFADRTGPVRGLVEQANAAGKAASLFALLILRLTGGLVLSVVRAGTIDKTFERVPFCKVEAHSPWRCTPREEPEYAKLVNAGHREAFLLAE
jgi:hypothetical protein